MSNFILVNTQLLLEILASMKRDEIGEAWVSGPELVDASHLSPAEINDAIIVLREGGLVEWRQYMGTVPFQFGIVTITSRGRYQFQQMIEQKKHDKEQIQPKSQSLLPLTPVGSPYGFTDEDWETLVEVKSQSNELQVVLGYQFKSDKYDSTQLKKNVKEMFEKAVAEYNQQTGVVPVTLTFQSLSAGYGEHLFNEIARDIISADIAVFETSELNPNVMLEMGVALTWGIRVLPIKNEDCPKPPSDISGQTWANHRNSAAQFIDPEHHRKLVRMVERAARKKGR